MASALLKILKVVKDAEKEARRILDEANIQAEGIRREAKRKAEAAYEDAYEKAIAETKRKSGELKQKKMDEAELEAENFLHRAEEQIEEIRAKAEKRFDDAVNAVMNEILFIDR